MVAHVWAQYGSKYFFEGAFFILAPTFSQSTKGEFAWEGTFSEEFPGIFSNKKVGFWKN